jgi:ankyrin repeat protein
MASTRAETTASRQAAPTAEKIAAVAGLNYDRLTELLRRPGADINVRNGLGLTALHIAINKGDIVAVETLLRQDADIEAVTDTGQRPLYFAVDGEKVEAVACLLKHGAVADADVQGLTALHAASLKGLASIVQLLIDHKADVNAVSALGDPLFLAVRSRKADVVQILLGAGADPDAFRHDLDPPTALHLASLCNDTDVMRRLMEAKARVDLRDIDGATPLFRAVERNNLDAAALLLENGASVHIWRTNRASLLDAAWGKADMLKLLRKGRVLMGPKIGVGKDGGGGDDDAEFEQPFTILDPSPPPAYTDRNKMVACQGFDAIVTDFYTSGGQEVMIQKKPSIYALLYSHGPGEFRGESGDGAPDFTWYHLPANNVWHYLWFPLSNLSYI